MSAASTSKFCLMRLQVLVGFVATGYLTFCLVLIYYIYGCVEIRFLNSIDRGFLHHAKRVIKPRLTSKQALTLRRAVLMYSDQQLVTSIALLAGGFAQLNHGLDAYHWQILVYLVWFSSLTHLTTLTVLRQYFRDNSALRSWRIVFMLITVIMLGVALVPTGNPFWQTLMWNNKYDAMISIPVLCYYQPDAPSWAFYGLKGPTFNTTVSIVVLFVGYLTRLIKLSNKAAAFNKYWLRTAPGALWKNWMIECDNVDRSNSRYLLHKVRYIIMEVAYVCLHGWYEVYDSMLWEVSFQ